jgi:hypothetical protein
MTLHVASDQRSSPLQIEIHQTKNPWKAGDEGTTDGNGSFTKQLTWNSATATESPMAGDAVIAVQIRGPQFKTVTCSLTSKPPPG